MQDPRNTELICRINHIHPINHWPKYRTCMEYSDKLILPYSTLLLIRRAHHPLPPLFKVWSQKTQEFLVLGVLNFAAEESHGFFPNWVIKQMNIEKFSNIELNLELLPVSKNNLYPFPTVRRVDAFIEDFVDYESCKKALNAYSTLSKGDWIKIMVEEKVYKVYILLIQPKNKCLVKDTLFDLNLKTLLPKLGNLKEVIQPKRNERRMCSLDRTKTKFSEILKSKYSEPGPPLDCLQAIPSIYRQNKPIHFRYSAYNWNQSPQLTAKRERNRNKGKMVEKGTESLDIQPWDNTDISINRVHASQTPPMPTLKPLIYPNGQIKAIMNYGNEKN